MPATARERQGRLNTDNDGYQLEAGKKKRKDVCQSVGMATIPFGRPDLIRKKMPFGGVIRAIIFQNQMKHQPPKPESLPNQIEKTHRTKPETAEKFFPTARIRNLLDQILVGRLHNVSYDSKVCCEVTRELCETIKSCLKGLGFPRYKLVCEAILGQKADQEMTVASRCLWDDEMDNYECVSFVNNSLFAVVIVYGSYHE